jgi:hypothetical protein
MAEKQVTPSGRFLRMRHAGGSAAQKRNPAVRREENNRPRFSDCRKAQDG